MTYLFLSRPTSFPHFSKRTRPQVLEGETRAEDFQTKEDTQIQ
jgi:hypothetical protein